MPYHLSLYSWQLHYGIHITTHYISYYSFSQFALSQMKYDQWLKCGFKLKQHTPTWLKTSTECDGWLISSYVAIFNEVILLGRRFNILGVVKNIEPVAQKSNLSALWIIIQKVAISKWVNYLFTYLDSYSLHDDSQPWTSPTSLHWRNNQLYLIVILLKVPTTSACSRKMPYHLRLYAPINCMPHSPPPEV
jgi:hypothetical protein